MSCTRPNDLRMTTPSSAAAIAEIAAAIRARHRFVLSSHARPDGDSIGSQLAMAYALRALGKEVVCVNKDAAPSNLMPFPGVSEIQVAPEVQGEFDAAIIMECSDLSRTGVAGLERSFVINIDHHPGNTGYGQINWFDPSAAACAEMVFDLIQGLGAALTVEIATHVYMAIVTDTGSFHYSGISPHTFDICRQLLEAGVDPVAMSRQIFDSNSMGRLRIMGALLNDMQVDSSGRVASFVADHAMVQAAGGGYEDTEGVVNLPLTVKEIVAVVFLKQIAGDEYRVSLRSKGNYDVGSVARSYGGGGHKNAAGCTVRGPIDQLRAQLTDRVQRVVQS
jgi:bifunctional oligoribonuclease and PAP phosphatase NrnA